jgi:hypothetical protein
MQSFCNQLQDHDNRMSSSVQGMIVDGALAMSTYSSRTSITTTAEGDEVAAKDKKALCKGVTVWKALSSDVFDTPSFLLKQTSCFMDCIILSDSWRMKL